MPETTEPCARLIGFQTLWVGRVARRIARRLASPPEAAIGTVVDLGQATADPEVTKVHVEFPGLPGEMLTFRAGELRYRNPESSDAAFHTLHDLIGRPPVLEEFYRLLVQETHIVEYEYIVRAHTPEEAVIRAEQGERVESRETALLDVTGYDPSYNPATYGGVVRIEDPTELARLREWNPDADERMPDEPFQCRDCGALWKSHGHQDCPTPGDREESPVPESSGP